MPEDWKAGGFGLYIHWPYCKAKCPYCDFNSHVAAKIDEKRWISAYLSEIDRLAKATSGRVLNTVYFGGGTPSLMSPDLVNAILERIKKSWTVSNRFEVTLEANPTSVEAGRFQGYRDASVNRLSMGFQAMNDADLKALGRLHTVAEGRKAFELARNTFDLISFDLIYARQNQSLASWKAELGAALELSASHLSLYQLTIENGTAFGDRFARGALSGLPNEGISADMYFATQEICEAAGMPAYEISNHAHAGAESQHNLIYWQGGDYGGIGPGAHGRLTLGSNRYATDTLLSPNAWLDQVEQTGSGDASRRPLPQHDQASEYLMMGLRLRDGISIARYQRLLGNVIDPKKLDHMVLLEMVTIVDDTLKTTPKGRPVLNAILRELLPD
ncbi:MAG: radical SAM family heme chaperone HemW [Paracoccaceae bacterium]